MSHCEFQLSSTVVLVHVVRILKVNGYDGELGEYLTANAVKSGDNTATAVLRGMDDRTSTACCHCRLFLQAPRRSHTYIQHERLRIAKSPSPRVKTTGSNKKRLLIATNRSTWVIIWDNANFTSTTCVGNPNIPLLQTDVLYIIHVGASKKAHLLYLVHIWSFYPFLHAKTEMNRRIATWMHCNIIRCTRSRSWLHSCRCQFPHFLQAHPVAITHGATQRLFHKHQGRQ